MAKSILIKCLSLCILNDLLLNFHHCQFPYSMKIYPEFYLVTWLRMVKFTELKISGF